MRDRRLNFCHQHEIFFLRFVSQPMQMPSSLSVPQMRLPRFAHFLWMSADCRSHTCLWLME